MSDAEHTTGSGEPVLAGVAQAVDGRVARRERNIAAVLDVILEMFAEESLFPTIEDAAKRSGLSLRSLYRYFSDPGELLEATIMRSRERGVAVAHLRAIGKGPLDQRIDDFVAMRLRVYEVTGAVWQATVANAPRHPRLGEELAATRDELRDQFASQFKPELDRVDEIDRIKLLTAGDLATQPGSIDFLCRTRGLSLAEAHAVVCALLHGLFR